MHDSGPVTRRGFLRGAAGTAALAGAAGTATAQEGGGETVEVALVDFAFEPGTEEPLTIPPGTTVRFVWETASHNIVVDSKPEGSDWTGHEPIENSGFETSHTFETTGEYHILCQPHESLGMVGDIVVEEGAAPPGEGSGGEGGGAPAIPDAAKSLGVGLFGAMLASLALVYFLVKYGGDYGEATE